MELADNNPYYLIRDGKKKAIWQFAAAVLLVTVGASVIIDGFMHDNYYVLIAGVLIMIAGGLFVNKVNSDIDQKIVNFIQSVDQV